MSQGDGFWGDGLFDEGSDQQPNESVFFGDGQPQRRPAQQPSQPWPDDPGRDPRQGGLLPDQTAQWARDENQRGGGGYDGGGGRSPDRRMLIWFLLAAVVAAIIGAGYAGYTVLGDSSSDLDAATTTTVDPALTTTTTTIPTTTSTTAPTGLQVALSSNGFVCDGTVQDLGALAGADPNEEVQFTSPQSSGIKPGQADELGNLNFRWVCDPSQVGTNWFLTATGVTSGRQATFSFLGVATAEEASAVTPDQAGSINIDELGPLQVAVTENPFNCDGEPRDFATLSGALPQAQIDFASEQATGLRPGEADADGNLIIRWQCLPEQAGTVWELTATESSTERSVAFTFIGR